MRSRGLGTLPRPFLFVARGVAVCREKKEATLSTGEQVPPAGLAAWGWDAGWQAVWDEVPRLGEPARVIEEQRGLYRIVTGQGACEAELSGRFRHEGMAVEALPGVGDYVDATPASRHRIHGVLPRRSQFVRKAAGEAARLQVAAANIDYTFIVQALGQDVHDFNVRRLERYLALAWDGGSSPVVVLNKADQALDTAARIEEAEAVAVGVPVWAVSAATGAGLGQLTPLLQPGKTVVLLGSSGVGKSTLVNALRAGGDPHAASGEEALQAVGAVRLQDGRGRHTTTSRHLLRLAGGALLIDTPGMREVGLTGLDGGLGSVFAEIDDLAAGCRFADCRHDGEPGCAVQDAVVEGTLDPGRLDAYRRLEREQAFQARKEDRALASAERRLWAQRTRDSRTRRREKFR